MRRSHSHKLLPLLLTVAACGRPTAPPSHGLGSRGTDAVLTSSDRIKDVNSSDRPTLRLLHREGDPLGAVALAVFPPGGSRQALLVSALLQTRLVAAGFRSATFQVHSLGVVVAQEAKTGTAGKRFLAAARLALLTPVADGDPAIGQAAARLSARFGQETPPSAVDDCLGLLGSEGFGGEAEPVSQRELEKVRRKAATASRIGLAALGSPSFLTSIAEGHDDSWPKGPAIDDAWTGPEQVNVASGYPELTLRIAVRAADQEAALSAARALRRKDHPIHGRLLGVSEELLPLSAHVTLRPRGACLAMSWVLASTAQPPGLDTLSAAALVARDEMRQSLRDARTEDESTLALLAPSGALEAVGLAAWTAVRSPGDPGPDTAVIELRGGPTWEARQKDFRAALTKAQQAFSERGIPLTARVEGGQAETWLLVASPCGTAAELPEEAGLRALTIASLARAFSGIAHVTLEPWISEKGVGLLAHSPPLRGETTDHHAARIARALGQALAGPPLDGRDVAAARAEHLSLVGNDPGRDLTLRVLSAPRTSYLSPLGLEQELATLSASDVERARAALAREPLQAALLASGARGQADAASAALTAWLAPSREGVTPCQVPHIEPGQGGRYTVTTVDENVEPSITIGVPAQAPRQVGQALVFLLNRPGGYLDRALVDPGLVASASAEWRGNDTAGALILSIHADSEDLAAAAEQGRAILDDLAHGSLTAADARIAQATWQTERATIAREPRGRVVELLQQAVAGPSPPTPLSRAELLLLTRQLSQDRHRVTTVLRR